MQFFEIFRQLTQMGMKKPPHRGGLFRFSASEQAESFARFLQLHLLKHAAKALFPLPAGQHVNAAAAAAIYSLFRRPMPPKRRIALQAVILILHAKTLSQYICLQQLYRTCYCMTALARAFPVLYCRTGNNASSFSA